MDARKHFQATGRNETEFARISDLIGLEEARDHAAGEANAAVGAPPAPPAPAVDPRRADLERRRDELNRELAALGSGAQAEAPNAAP